MNPITITFATTLLRLIYEHVPYEQWESALAFARQIDQLIWQTIQNLLMR